MGGPNIFMLRILIFDEAIGMNAEARPHGCDYTSGMHLSGVEDLSANVPASGNHKDPDRLLPSRQGHSRDSTTAKSKTNAFRIGNKSYQLSQTSP